VKLGCVMPGESPAVFGDALRRLAASAATYLYQDGTALLVLDAADGDQAGRRPGRAAEARTRQGRARAGASACARTSCARATSRASTRCPERGRTCPTTPTRAWWCWRRLSLQQGRRQRRRDWPRRRSWSCAAMRPASTATRWCSWRRTRQRLEDLDEAAAQVPAWESILAEKDAAEPDAPPGEAGRDADGLGRRRGRPPACPRPTSGCWCRCRRRRRGRWTGRRSSLSGQDALAVRASKKLRNDELYASIAGDTPAHGAGPGAALARRPRRREAAGRGFRPVRLPAAPEGFVRAGRRSADGVALLTWEADGFRVRDSFDDDATRAGPSSGGPARRPVQPASGSVANTPARAFSLTARAAGWVSRRSAEMRKNRSRISSVSPSLTTW
jgi:hypothetical protein